MGSVQRAVRSGGGRAVGGPLGGHGRVSDTAAPDPGPLDRTVLPGAVSRVGGHLRVVADADGRSRRPAGGRRLPPGRRRDPGRPGGRRPQAGDRSGRGVRGGCAGAVPAPLRLTRRGRLLVVVLATALGIGLLALGHALVGGGPGDGLRLAGDRTVVVQQGDTVWSIAAEVAGAEADVRGVVDAIEALNDLEDAVVVPGQVLELP